MHRIYYQTVFTPYSTTQGPNERNHANVMMVTNRALQWGVDPVALIGSSYVVGGKLDFEGKVFIAVINALAGLRSNLSFEFEGEGDSLAVTVIGQLASEPLDKVRTITADYLSAVTRDKNSKITDQWTRDPRQKLAYTAAKRWARLHAPGVTLGLFAEDEDALPMNEITVASRPTQAAASTPKLTEAKPSTTRTTKVNYADRIADCTSRSALEHLVDRIKCEVPAVLAIADRDELVQSCKTRWRELEDTDTEADTQ